MADGQMGFEGMPRRLLQAAPSRLVTYLDCPRRYRFGYLDRPTPPKGPPWAHNSLGAAVHTALASWWKLPVDQRTVERAGDLLDAAWLVDGFRDAAQRDAAQRRAREMVQTYVADLDPVDEPIGVERTVALKTEHAALFGRVDRIDDRGIEGIVIVDYKTGRHVLTVDDARTSLALAVYAAGAERTLRRRCRRVELHHLPTGEVVAWEHTDEAMTRHIGRADSIAAEIAELDMRFKAGVDAAEADRMYPPQVSALCGWCDFNRSCPEGSAVAGPRAPWAGLEEP
ncbi:MAG: PD-(D/E)XK nuclease family protein [Actinomycetota bacterium]|nr:PD-(D/E)XK nuclease family protein [Actinomycetota bacterium]